MKCPKCLQEQWSIMDKNYLRLYGQCWSCDRANWEGGTLTLAEFEEREKQALKNSEA